MSKYDGFDRTASHCEGEYKSFEDDHKATDLQATPESDRACSVQDNFSSESSPEHEPVPVAWMIFEGELGQYSLRLYECNETYRDDFIRRNPSLVYRDWVEPLYTAAQLRAEREKALREAAEWCLDAMDGATSAGSTDGYATALSLNNVILALIDKEV